MKFRPVLNVSLILLIVCGLVLVSGCEKSDPATNTLGGVISRK